MCENVASPRDSYTAKQSSSVNNSIYRRLSYKTSEVLNYKISNKNASSYDKFMISLNVVRNISNSEKKISQTFVYTVQQKFGRFSYIKRINPKIKLMRCCKITGDMSVNNKYFE